MPSGTLLRENRGRWIPFHISIGRDVCTKDEAAMSGIDRFSILTAPYYCKYYLQLTKDDSHDNGIKKAYLHIIKQRRLGEIARFAVISWGRYMVICEMKPVGK